MAANEREESPVTLTAPETTVTAPKCAAETCDKDRRKAGRNKQGQPYYGRHCSMHAERLRAHGTLEPITALTLPAAPLNAFAESRGIEAPAKGQTVSLDFADEVCCNVLRVHPSAVYGAAYFNL